MDIKMATNKPRRKTYSDEFKEFLVQEAISSGRSIASIARDNGINQNLAVGDASLVRHVLPLGPRPGA